MAPPSQFCGHVRNGGASGSFQNSKRARRNERAGDNITVDRGAEFRNSNVILR